MHHWDGSHRGTAAQRTSPPPPPPVVQNGTENSPPPRNRMFPHPAGRILTEEEFRTEATVKYDGLSVEDATRGGKLEAYSAPPNAALTVLGSGLFAFLQGRIAATCRNVYPVVSEPKNMCMMTASRSLAVECGKSANSTSVDVAHHFYIVDAYSAY